MAIQSTESLYTNGWTVDSACSNHMTANRGIFVNLRPVYNVSIKIANGKRERTEGIGDVRIKLEAKETSIHRVYYVAGLGQGINLLSTAQLADRGIMTLMQKEGVELHRQGRMIGRARREGNRYILSSIEQAARHTALITNEETPDEEERKTSSKNNKDYALWHRRLAHAGREKLHLLFQATKGLREPLRQPRERESDSACEPCVLAKQAKVISRTTPERATRPLQRVHTDFAGPLKETSLGGNSYLLTFTDDYSRKTWVDTTKTRTELYEKFKAWKQLVEKE